MRWYEGFSNRPPVCLVHGEPDAAEAFSDRLDGAGSRWVQLSRPGLNIDLNELGRAPAP